MKGKQDLAIGVFDSGIGGLTVVRELMRQLPGERIVYFGDTARAPYGNKSPRALVRFALENSRFLVSRHIKFLVVACNSSSAYSLPALRQRLKVPVLGVVLAGARAAVSRRHGQKLGVIGTRATIQSGAYQKAIKELSPGTTVYAQACPLFVPLVEEGWNQHRVAEMVAKDYLLALKRRGIDTLVLGCTHYPLLKAVIHKVLGRGVALVDSASETAHEVKEMLATTGLLAKRKSVAFSSHEFYVSDLPGQFSELGKRFLGRSISKVTQIALKELL